MLSWLRWNLIQRAKDSKAKIKLHEKKVMRTEKELKRLARKSNTWWHKLNDPNTMTTEIAAYEQLVELLFYYVLCLFGNLNQN